MHPRFPDLPIRIGAFVLAFAGQAPSPAADQPQWGQRYSRNMVADEKGLPESFDPETDENLQWTVPLGTQSHATPVVAGGKVLVGTNNGRPRDPRHEGDRGILLCLDSRDGHLLWQLVVPKISHDEYQDWPGVGIVSPPTVEGDRVYLMTNRGEIVCLDLDGHTDGNDGPFREEGRYMVPPGTEPLAIGPLDADIIWLYDLVGELGVRLHDEAHSSILLHGPFLYLCTANGVDSTHRRIPSPDAPSLVVLHKTSGRLVARDALHIGPQLVHSTWSSPSLGVAGGRTLVFFGGGNGICYAFEALAEVPQAEQVLDLEPVWRFDCDPRGPRGDLLTYQDNRRIGPSTITGMPVFHEGRIYVTAGGDLWHGKTRAWIKCIDAAGRADITASGQIWSQELRRHSMSTPAVSGGLVYIADCGRQVHCLDAETGKPCWTHEAGGEIWGSTLVADGKVYVGTRRGDLWVLAAAREKRVLARVSLSSPMSATPVAADGVLYVACSDRLYAARQGARASP